MDDDATHIGRPPEGVPAGELNDAVQEFMALVPRLVTALAHRTGMSRSELEALQHLAIAPMGPSDLAATLGMTPAAGTQVVDRLERRGHVTRVPHPGDARRVLVRPSDAAIAEVVGQLMPMLLALRDAEEGFTAQEKAAIRRYLGRAGDAVRLLIDG